MQLIQQELDELQTAFAHRDVAVAAKELADLLYAVYGTAISCGIEMAPVFREVHRSKMNQVGVRQRADGTWIGPVGYTPHPVSNPFLLPRTAWSTLTRLCIPNRRTRGRVVYATTLQAGTLGPVPIDKPLRPCQELCLFLLGAGCSHVVHVEPMSRSGESEYR